MRSSTLNLFAVIFALAFFFLPIIFLIFLGPGQSQIKNARIDLFMLMLLGIGIFLFFYGFSRLKRKRLIENTPTSKIRSLAMGFVEIYGEAIPAQQTLKSPFSQSECLYYAYEIEEYRKSGKSSHWVTIKMGEQSTPFFLKDETSQVLVDLTNADIEIPKDAQYNSRLGIDPPNTIKQFLQKNKMSFESFLGMNKSMRFTEHFIAPGDKLYIMGDAADNPHVAEGTALHGSADIMIQKGKHKIFYVSDSPEKEIIKSLKYQSLGGIFGGIACTAASLTIIFINLGII